MGRHIANHRGHSYTMVAWTAPHLDMIAMTDDLSSRCRACCRVERNSLRSSSVASRFLPQALLHPLEPLAYLPVLYLQRLNARPQRIGLGRVGRRVLRG